PAERSRGRNAEWQHLNNADIISMPDKWEYPWYAAWDLAFHCVPLALVDSEFAKSQLTLLTREWYMHPNGQLPAYEWAFGDVNPPVHAWATWRVFQMDRKERREHNPADAGDIAFRSEWSIARLRMGLWRREPARSRLGHLACFPDGPQRAPRTQSRRRRRYRIPIGMVNCPLTNGPLAT